MSAELCHLQIRIRQYMRVSYRTYLQIYIHMVSHIKKRKTLRTWQHLSVRLCTTSLDRNFPKAKDNS